MKFTLFKRVHTKEYYKLFIYYFIASYTFWMECNVIGLSNGCQILLSYILANVFDKCLLLTILLQTFATKCFVHILCSAIMFNFNFDKSVKQPIETISHTDLHLLIILNLINWNNLRWCFGNHKSFPFQ